MVKDCMEGSRQIRKDAPDQILIVKYDELMSSPKETLKRIESFLELPTFEYDFDNIENDTSDDDLVAWGFEGLHSIRPKLEKVSKDPKEILGEELFNRFIELEKQYI
jgi:sulfotransferase